MWLRPPNIEKAGSVHIPSIPCISFHDAFQDEWSCSATLSAFRIFQDVEIILGRDAATREVFLVYGRDKLCEVLRQDIDTLDTSDVNIVMIEVERRTDELNQLLALVEITKDGYEYVEAV